MEVRNLIFSEQNMKTNLVSFACMKVDASAHLKEGNGGVAAQAQFKAALHVYFFGIDATIVQYTDTADAGEWGLSVVQWKLAVLRLAAQTQQPKHLQVIMQQ